MMPRRYVIRAAKYPFEGWHDKTWETKWLPMMLFRYFIARFKYEIVDVEICYRNHAKIDRLNR